MQLNPEQAQCVSEDGHCLVVACPGSGKTRVITRKIAALFERHPDSRVCAVTFTRDAARELSERVIKEIGENKFKLSCRIGTFHSLAIRQLRLAGRLGKVAGPAQQYALLVRAVSQTAFDGEMQDAISIIEAAKTSLGTSSAAEGHILYRAYADLLARQKLVDLYDVLRDSVLLMRSGEIRPFPVQFMLVDEFQDTDRIQFAWVMEHVRAGVKVTCVGDDDQSIYSWRGALGYAGMEEFRKLCNAKHITLNLNYRSHAEILSLADLVITPNNDARVIKKLIAHNGAGGVVESIRVGKRSDEADEVAAAIFHDCMRLPNTGGPFTYSVPAGKWVVLARNRRHLDYIESSLQDKGIRYQRAAGDSLWTRRPFVQMLSLLRSLQTGDTDGVDDGLHYALATLVGAGEADQTLAKLHTLAGSRFKTILDGECPPIEAEIMAEEAAVIRGFAGYSALWRQRLRQGQYSLVIRGVAAWFSEREPDPDQKQLIETMGEFLCKLKGSLVARSMLVDRQEEKKKKNSEEGALLLDGNQDGVVLATMHAAKGLEFDNVWIIGCNEGVIPSPKAANLSEERRLLYVAITRAKKRLILSAATSGRVTPLLTEVGFNIPPLPVSTAA